MNFEQAGEQFRQLKARFEVGALSEAEFKAQLQELMVLDEQGSWWMIGYETERWYRHDGTSWVQADPPGILPLKPALAVPAASKAAASKSTQAAAHMPAAQKTAARVAPREPEAERRKKEEVQRMAARGSKEAAAAGAHAAPTRRSPLPLAAAGLVVLLLASIGGYALLRGRAQGATPAPPPTQAEVDTSAVIPGTGARPTPAPTETAVQPSPTPEATATPGPQFFLTISVSRATLYEGPGLGYALVSQDPYPRDTRFTVLARDPSGLWFLSRAPDGREGWLYKDWVHSDVDLALVPAAATLPAAPTGAPRKPKGPGNPQPTTCFGC